MDDEIERAHRYVVEGRQIVLRQQDLIARFQGQQLSTHAEEWTLGLYERSLWILEEHLARLESEAKRRSDAIVELQRIWRHEPSHHAE
jgi:hypothetical protein